MLYVFAASEALFRFLADFIQLNHAEGESAEQGEGPAMLPSDAVTPDWNPSPSDAALLLAPVPSGMPENTAFRVVRLTDANGRDRYPDLLTDSAFSDCVLPYGAGTPETAALYDKISSHFSPERFQVYLCPEGGQILQQIFLEAKTYAALPSASQPILSVSEEELLDALCDSFYASDAMKEELGRLFVYLHFHCADPVKVVLDYVADCPQSRNRKEGKERLASFREYCSLT